MSLLIPLLLACATVPQPPPVAGGAEAPVVATEAGPPPVSFAPLEERVNVLIADARETDRRDRLVAARELMHAMRNKDPIAQRKVYEYLDQVFTIEERSRPASIPIEGFGVPIEEETLGATEPSARPPAAVPSTSFTPLPSIPAPADATAQLTAARTALAESRYLDAVDALAGAATPNAAALRKEAVDGWARQERERAGHLFLEARQLPPGNERIASLRAVRTALTAINERFPDNAYAAQIADNVAKVDADLAAAGARP